MRRTAMICAALAAFALSAAPAQAGFLFFGDSCAPKVSCCNSAPKCCNAAPKCSSGGLFSIFKLPKLELPKLGGSNCNAAPACCKPAPRDCSGSSVPAAELSPSAGGSKVEDAPPPPPYEDKAPAPEAAKKPAAPAPPTKPAAPAEKAKDAAKKVAPAPKA